MAQDAIAHLKADHRKVEADLLDESFVEHDGAKVLIVEIEGGKPSDDYFDAKVTVLAEQIKHHVHEEEAFLKGLFAQARRSDLDLDALGKELAARKEELVARYQKELPRPEARTFETVSL